MASVAVIQEANGAGPTLSSGTTFRYCTADSFEPASNNPIPIPTADYNYSYWKQHRLFFKGVAAGGYVENIRWYTDGAIGWDLGSGSVKACCLTTPTSGHGTPTYDQATGTEGTTGHDVEDNTDGHSAYATDGFTTGATDCVVGAPLLIDNNRYYGTDGGGGPDRFSMYFVTQVLVGANATQGPKAAETFTLLYDEV